MRAVNLLPRDQKQRTVRKESVPVLVGACAGVLVAALLGAMFMMGSGKIAAQQRKLDDLNRKYDAFPPPPAGPRPPSSSWPECRAHESPRSARLSPAESPGTASSGSSRLVLPEDVWLTTLTAKSPVSPATNAATSAGGAPSQFLMQGRTYSHDGVARLLSRLQVVPDLTNVQLISSTLAKVGNQQVVEFSIGADIKVAGTPSS